MPDIAAGTNGSAQTVEAAVSPNGRVREQVEDALYRLNFAIQSGFKTADGKSIPLEPGGTRLHSAQAENANAIM